MSAESETCKRALTLMVEALKLLDQADIALDAGAHLDLAIACLRERLREDGTGLDYAGAPFH